MSSVFLDKIQKILFFLTVLVTVVFLYYPTYLPMADLPQHTALVATMDDLLKGKSPWADMLWINWDTPYIAIYLVWLLLYQIMPILWATKTVIVLIFLLYVYAIILLRKTFEADKMLDWVGLTCFFGFSFQWGFVPFVFGTTVGLLFLSFNKRYLDNPNKKDLCLIFLTGTLTYFSHLLAYAFFCMVGYSLFIFSSLLKFSWRQRIIFTVPYLCFALMILHYLTSSSAVSNNMQYTLFDVSWYLKLKYITYSAWNMYSFEQSIQLLLYFIWIIPLFCLNIAGKKINYIPLLLLLGIWFFLPHNMLESFYLWERFAGLIPIFYFLIWQPKIQKQFGKNLRTLQIGYALFIVIIFSMLWKVYNNNIIFANSSNIKEYEYIFNKIKPRKRMLYMITNNSAHNGKLTSGYELYHFALYYQALKQGWVDFNFASEHAIPVRFTQKATYEKNWNKNTSLTKNALDEKRLDCTGYDYLLIRPSRNALTRKIVNQDTINDSISKNEKCLHMKLLFKTDYLMLYEKEIN